jgi:hypothetical protein
MKTEYAFRLPHGYRDTEGVVHRDGVMRLATARDEISLLADPRVQADRSYLMVLLLSRVVIKLGLGDVQRPSLGIIESLDAADLAYLQAHYHQINEDPTPFMNHLACPSCHHPMEVDMITGSSAPPIAVESLAPEPPALAASKRSLAPLAPALGRLGLEPHRDGTRDLHRISAMSPERTLT